ncbi:MAG: ATP-binding protein [Gemmatimonadota bacterium]|nr:MAG: ATP-binding protein [Gemmatimonadota bacterium]
MRSFRLRLAIRFTGWLAILVVLLSGSAYFALRYVIYGQIDETLLRLAEIEDGATSDAPDSAAHFHDHIYSPAQSDVSQRSSHYAEIWTSEGVAIIRSANLVGADLTLPVEALRTGGEGRAVWFTYEGDLGTLRSLVYPLSHGATRRPGWILQVAAPLGPSQEVLLAFLKILVLVGGLGVMGSFAGTWYFAGQAMRPVKQIAEQAGRLEPGRSAGTITVEGASAEHDRLVEVLNRAFDQALHAVRMQRQFTADASHDIRTPLAIIQGDIEVALRHDRSREDYQELLESTLEEARRLARITDDLMTLAHSDANALPFEIAPVHMDGVIAGLLARYRSLADRRGISLEYSGSGDTALEGDEDWLRRAIGNVIENALRYTPEGGSVRVHARRLSEDGEAFVRVEVEDDGPGIAPDDVPRLFDRFYRTDQARGARRGGGTGLGLPITKAIIEGQGGTVEIQSQLGEGTHVLMTLPVIPVVRFEGYRPH